jgi:hypothetical protein
MATFVRNGYVVLYRNYRIEAGQEIPAAILPEIMKNQSWKVEDRSGKEREKQEEETATEATNSDGKKEEIIDIASNRMVKEKEAKRK